YPDAAGQRRLADIQRRDPLDDLLRLLRLLQHPASLLATRSTAMGARRSRKGQAESDPRARGNTEGPRARLPASDQTTAPKGKGVTAAAGTPPDFPPGTGRPPGRLETRRLIPYPDEVGGCDKQDEVAEDRCCYRTIDPGGLMRTDLDDLVTALYV